MTEQNRPVAQKVSDGEKDVSIKWGRRGLVLGGIAFVLLICIGCSVFVGLSNPFLGFMSAPFVALPFGMITLIVAAIGLYYSIKAIRTGDASVRIGWGGGVLNSVTLLITVVLTFFTAIYVGMFASSAFAPDSDVILGTAVSPTGQTIAISHQSQILLIDANTGEELNILRGHQSGGITVIEFSPDGATLASADSGNTLIFWKVATGEKLHTVNFDTWFNYFYFSPGGEYLAVWRKDEGAKVINTATYEMIENVGDRELVETWGFEPSSYTFKEDYDASKLLIWHASDLFEDPNAQPLAAIPIRGDEAYNYMVSPDGKILALAAQTVGTTYHFKLEFWDMAEGDLLHTIQLDPPADSQTDKFAVFGFSPDGESLTYMYDPNILMQVDLSTFEAQELDATLPGGSDFENFYFLNDGSKILVTRSESIALWGMPNQQLLWEYKLQK